MQPVYLLDSGSFFEVSARTAGGYWGRVIFAGGDQANLYLSREVFNERNRGRWPDDAPLFHPSGYGRIEKPVPAT